MTVVQALILFGSNTWVLTLWLEKALEGFRHLAAGLMAGMGPKRHPERTWLYPPIGAALAMVELEEIRVYITRLQNTVAQYISTRPIMDLYLAAEQKWGIRLSRRLWEHPTLDTIGIRAGQVAAEGGGGDGEGENRSWRERESRVGADNREIIIW